MRRMRSWSWLGEGVGGCEKGRRLVWLDDFMEFTLSAIQYPLSKIRIAMRAL